MSPGRRSRLTRRIQSSRQVFRNKLSYHRRLRLEALEDRRLLAAFTPGNVVAYRIGVLFGPLTSAAAPVFIDEFDPDGNLVQSIPLPTAVAGNQRRLTASGINTTEGLLTRSTDGQYLVLTGYDANVGTTAVTATSSATTNRVVGRVDALGNIDTSTAISDGYSGNSIRGAATVDGTTLWTSGGGSSGGVRALQFGNTGSTTQVSTTTTDTRDIEIFGGQLFVSGNPSFGPRLGQVGTGIPTTSGQTIVGLPGVSVSNLTQPFQFFAADLEPSVPGPDTLYVADEATSTGIRKFSLVNDSWVYNGNMPFGVLGARGLTGKVVGSTVTIYASDTTTSNNSIWKVIDTSGWNATLSFNPLTLFNSGIPGTVYRGVALVPVAAEFGDAPDSYHTLTANNGPTHVPFNATLGPTRDTEGDGQPSAGADGDDFNSIDDEDGVTFPAPLVASANTTNSASVNINASASARLDAWIDFNGNGVFDVAERITGPAGTAVVAGNNVLSFTVPAGASVGSTYSRFRISTLGGLLPTGPADDGEVEDYQVSIQAPPTGTTDVSLSGGYLAIADIGNDDTNDTLTLSRLTAPDRLRVFDPINALIGGPGTTQVNANTVDVLFASITGNIQVNTLGGSDTLTVDLSGGDAIPPGDITFAGGTPTIGPGDSLIIIGGNQGRVTYNYAGTYDGSVVMSSFGTVNYTGLEPIVNSGTASDIVFNLPAGPNTATLGDDGTSGNGLSRLSAATLESTDFANPTGSLTINRGSAADTMTVNGLPDFSASLTIGSGANPFGTVTFAGTITLATGKNLSAGGSTVSSTAAGDVAVSGGGSISLAADAAAINGSSSFSAGTGTFSIVPVIGGQQIDLGGGDAASTLGLTDAELDRITAGTINIGDANSGTITVSAAITHSASTNFALTSNGEIVFNPGSISTGGGALMLAPGASGSVQPITSGIDVTTAVDSAVSFGAGADLAIAVNGPTADAGYSQLHVAGQVDLTNVGLALRGSYIPSSSDSFIIVDNDGTDPIIGTFTGLAEGTTVGVAGVNMKITYVGGTGNDVVLLPVANAPPTADGTTGDDTFVLTRDGTVATDFRLSINGGPDIVYHNPATITINGLAGNDSLIVSDTGNASGGNFTITEGQIEWLTSFAGSPDISFQNIDVLAVTGTSGNDVFDILLNAGSDLDAATVNGNSGADQFFLDLNTADHTTNDVTGLATVNLNGDAGNDTFGNTPANAPPPAPPAPLSAPVYPVPAFPGAPRGAIEPSTTTNLVINGGAPTVGGPPPFNTTAGNTVGDTLNLDLSAAYTNPNATAIVSTVGGIAQTTGYKTINFSDIEAIHLIDGGLLTRVQMGDLYIRGSQNADIIQFGLTNTPNVASTRVNNTVQNLAVTTKTIVYGRGGNDVIMQGTLSKPAEFNGEAGDDYLAGYKFNDLLVGGDGNDRLLGGEGNNELWGDNLSGQTLTTGGNDILSAGSGNDKFYGGGGNDSISAGGGVDYAFGGFGDDSIDGGDGDDRLYGGEGNDTLSGANGHDLIAGNNGDDKLYGKAGNDVLIGGQGADLILGEDGNDLMFDGQVNVTSSPAGSDASTFFGDAHDQAMAALLSDWSADSLLNLLIITSLHDASLDSLGGMAGTDSASAGSGDIGDWENTLP